jgi:hypothetical protein
MQLLIRRYRLLPVVLVRDLADTVMSIRDHFRQESHRGPMANFTESHRGWSNPGLEEAIVRLAMPWYLNFYSGWRNAQGTLLVHYEEMIERPASTFGRIMQFARVPCEAKDVETMVQAFHGPKGRFNKGVVGRGRSLNPVAAEALSALMDLYPDYEEDDLFRRSRATIAEAKRASPRMADLA